MSDGWKNEDDIKAELRLLTSQVRKLREELRGMVAPPKANPSRAFLHRQSWQAAPPDTASDKPSRRRSSASPRKKNR